MSDSKPEIAFPVGLADEAAFIAAWGRAVKQYVPINVNAELLTKLGTETSPVTLDHAKAILDGTAFPPIQILFSIAVPMTYTPGGLVNRVCKDVFGK